MKRNSILGGGLWLVLAGSSLFRAVHLCVIELLFLFAPLVIVPLGLELCGRLPTACKCGFPTSMARWFQLIAAIFASGAFFFPPGIAAASLAIPWFCFACFLNLAAFSNLIRGRMRKPATACVAASVFYLGVGSVWLLASRLGMMPMGFQEPIVLLTAVHFHFAGFAAPLLVLAAGPSLKPGIVIHKFFQIVTAGVLVGPAFLAAGFILGPRVKLIAALFVALSEVGLSLLFLLSIPSLRPLLAKFLIATSAFSVLFAMFLAGIWAIG